MQLNPNDCVLASEPSKSGTEALPIGTAPAGTAAAGKPCGGGPPPDLRYSSADEQLPVRRSSR